MTLAIGLTLKELQRLALSGDRNAAELLGMRVADNKLFHLEEDEGYCVNAIKVRQLESELENSWEETHSGCDNCQFRANVEQQLRGIVMVDSDASIRILLRELLEEI